MDNESLKKKAAVQRSHALQRAKERYGLYFNDQLYDELLLQIRRALAWMKEHNTPYQSECKFLGTQEDGKTLVLKVNYLREWMFVIYDVETGELRTFLPPRIRDVKGMDVSAS